VSELAAILVGLGMGFLIALPALVAYRHDIARKFGRLAMESAGKTDSEPQQSSEEYDGGGGHLSPAIVIFGITAGAVTALYGAFLGGIVFLASGLFVMLSSVIAWLATWAVKD
jgi:hypothetical protein